MEENKTTADPSAALLFVFSISCFTTFGIYSGLLRGETYLLSGIMMLSSFPVYIIGGVMLAKRGDTYMSNLWLLFGVIFGGIMGFGNVAFFFSGIYGYSINCAIYAVPLLVSGVSVIITLIPFRTGPWVQFLTWFFACIWLITSSAEYIIASTALYYINMSMSFLVGVGTAYMMTNELLVAFGTKGLPQGGPFLKKR